MFYFKNGGQALVEPLDSDIPEGDCSMIALEQDGPGFVDIVVQLTSGTGVADYLIMDFDAVQNDGDLIPDHPCLDLLPLAWFTVGSKGAGGGVINVPIEPFVMSVLGSVVEDLDLVAAPKVET